MRRTLRSLLLLSFVCSSQLAHAFTNSTGEVEQGAELTSTTLGYVESQPNLNRWLQEFKISAPGSLKARGLPWLKLVWDPEFQASPWNDTTSSDYSSDVFESSSERYWLELPEAYAEAKTDSGLTLQAGMNTFTWGVTDGYNPLDVVSAHRYQDPLRSEKLGAPEISFKQDFGLLTFEGLYIPSQRRTILPGDNSRWLPREILQTRGYEINGQPATIYLPSVINYSYLPSQTDDNALSNNFGFRVQSQGILPGLDASLEFFDGAAPTPSVVVRQIALFDVAVPPVGYILQAQPNIVIQPIYYRQMVYGGSLVYANFDMIFKFETALTRVFTRDYSVPGSANEFVLSAEHSFPVGDDSLTAVLEATFAQHSDPDDNTTASLDRIFDRSAITGLRYSLGQKLTANGAFIFDTESHDELGHLDALYSLSDALKVGLAGDGMWGSLSSPIGVYHKNDRAYVTLKFLL